MALHEPQSAPARGPAEAQISLAAALCYLNEQTDAQIAAALGVCRRTLARWKRRPDFRTAFRAAALTGGWLVERQFRERWHAERRTAGQLRRATQKRSRRRT